MGRVLRKGVEWERLCWLGTDREDLKERRLGRKVKNLGTEGVKDGNEAENQESKEKRSKRNLLSHK